MENLTIQESLFIILYAVGILAIVMAGCGILWWAIQEVIFGIFNLDLEEEILKHHQGNEIKIPIIPVDHEVDKRIERYFASTKKRGG